MRVGPASPDQAALPVQDGLRCDQECRPPLPWHKAGEQGDDGSVRPGQTRLGHLAAQDCQLVAQHQYFNILCKAVHGQKSGEPEGPMNEAVEEREHQWGSVVGTILLVKMGDGRFLDPSGSKGGCG